MKYHKVYLSIDSRKSDLQSFEKNNSQSIGYKIWNTGYTTGSVDELRRKHHTFVGIFHSFVHPK